MPKFLNRVVALLLAFCLIVDPSWASTRATLIPANQGDANLFKILEQAIPPPAVNVRPHPKATAAEYQMISSKQVLNSKRSSFGQPAKWKQIIRTTRQVLKSIVLAPVGLVLGIGGGGFFLTPSPSPSGRQPIALPAHERFVSATDKNQLRQSFSGIRAIAEDGEDVATSPSYLLAFSMYGYFYALERMQTLERRSGQSLYLLLAGDPRPSGNAIRRALATGFLLAGQEQNIQIEIEDLGILTTPMAESAVRTLKSDGGVIITASHNPVKDNGIKFMTANNEDGYVGGGALLSAQAMDGLIQHFGKVRDSKEAYENLGRKFSSEVELPKVTHKAVTRVMDGYVSELRQLFPTTNLSALVHGVSVAVDTNGGSGSLPVPETTDGVIAWVLRQLGMDVYDVKTPVGEINHDIEPREGSVGLRDMRALLNKLHIPFGVVFDWDADRGTTALPDKELEPQDVAAFNVAMMLSWMDAYHQADHQQVIIIAHDATSRRVEEIAQLFSKPDRPVTVRRVETGEINVVSAMQEERHRGHYVPIGIEGANGGTILGNATCRDGVATAVLTALTLADTEIQRIWLDRLNGRKISTPTPTTTNLSHLFATLPSRHNVLGQITGVDIARIPEIKIAMEKDFQRVWNQNPILRQTYLGYEFQHYEGTHHSNHIHDGGMGGWSIIFRRADGQEDFIWMRPSRTEPFVRHMIDAVDVSSFQMLQRVFETIYTSAHQQIVTGNYEEVSFDAAPIQVLAPRRVNFSIRDDLDANDWLESRERKQYQLLRDLRMRWERRIGFASIAEIIQRLIADLLSRRERWYRDQEIPYSVEELRQEIIDRSPHFILEELIANAFDAYVAEHAEGPIELRISRRGDNFMIEVSDNGVGIAEVSRDSDGGLDFRSYRPKPGAQMHKRQGGKRIAIDWSNILMHLHGGSLEAWTPGLHGYKTTVRVTVPCNSVRLDIKSNDPLAKGLYSRATWVSRHQSSWMGKFLIELYEDIIKPTKEELLHSGLPMILSSLLGPVGLWTSRMWFIVRHYRRGPPALGEAIRWHVRHLVVPILIGALPLVTFYALSPDQLVSILSHFPGAEQLSGFLSSLPFINSHNASIAVSGLYGHVVLNTFTGLIVNPILRRILKSHLQKGNVEDDEKRLLQNLDQVPHASTADLPRSPEWRHPRPEDRTAIDAICRTLLDFYRGSSHDIALRQLDAALSDWKTLDRIPGLRASLHHHLEIASGLSRQTRRVTVAEIDQSSEWLRRFFRIYQHAFYIRLAAPLAGRQESLILLAPIRRIVPVHWREFSSVIEVAPDPRDTTITGGFTPLSNSQEVVVVNNNELILDPSLAALHEAEHRFQLMEFSEKGKTLTVADLEFTAYARTMVEIGRRMEEADLKGTPRSQQPHYLSDVFGGKYFLDLYLKTAHAENGESHTEATLRLLPSSLGEILEAMCLLPNQRHTAVDAIEGIAARVGSKSPVGLVIRAMGPTPARKGSLSREEVLSFLRSFSFDVWSQRLVELGYEPNSTNMLLRENLLNPILNFVQLNASGELIRLAAQSRYDRYYREALGYVPDYPNLAERPWVELSKQTSELVKEEDPRIAEIRSQILAELNEFYFPHFPGGRPWDHWTLHDWTRSRSSRCTLIGWMMYFVGEYAIDKAYAEYEAILRPLIPSNARYSQSDFFPEEVRHWKLYALLIGLAAHPEIPLASVAWMDEIVNQALRFEREGEGFRQQAWQDLNKGNDRTAVAYIFIRNRIFNGKEFGLKPNGINVMNNGPEPEWETDRYNRARGELVTYEWKNQGTGQSYKQRFHWYSPASQSRHFFGDDRFDSAAYQESEALYEGESPDIRRFYESLLPYMARPHGPGQGMDLHEYGQFSYAWHEVHPDPENRESENSFWWREDQQRFRDVVDQFHAQGQLPQILESIERLIHRVGPESRLEDKWLMHAAVGTLPYMFAKGYIDTDHDVKTTRKAFELLFAALDRDLLSSWTLDSWLIRYGRLIVDLMESRIRERKWHGRDLLSVLGSLARTYSPARTVVGTFLISCIEDSTLAYTRGGALLALSTLFEQAGLARDPGVIIGNPSASVDDFLRERFLEVLLKDLEYRGDWSRDNGGQTRAENAWHMLKKLGDARAIRPMMRYYEAAIKARKLNPDSWHDPEWNPIAKVLARMTPADIARTVVFQPELYPLWKLWRSRLFTSAQWRNINSTLEQENPRLNKAFQQVFSTEWINGNGRDDAGKESTHEKPVFDPSIHYEQDYYGILGIEDKKADQATVLSKYRSLARRLHEDLTRHSDLPAIDEMLKKIPKAAFDALNNSGDQDLVKRWRQDGINALVDYEKTDSMIRGLFTVIDEAGIVLRDLKKRVSYDKFSPFGASPEAGSHTTFTMFSADFLPAIPVVIGLIWGPDAAFTSAHYLLIAGLTWMTARLFGGLDKVLWQKAARLLRTAA